MRLEDVMLYVTLDEPASGCDAGAWCAQAIAGGADMIGVGPEEPAAAEVAAVCRRDDALLIVRGSAQAAAALGADGVQLPAQDGAFGLARTIVGGDGVLGAGSRTLEEATLGLELGADFVAHEAGSGCAAVFEALRFTATVPLFAGGLSGPEEASQLVERGIFRLCVPGRLLAPGDVTGQVAAYARLLGRCL